MADIKHFPESTRVLTYGENVVIDLRAGKHRLPSTGLVRPFAGQSVYAVDITERRVRLSVLRSKPGFASVYIYAEGDQRGRRCHYPLTTPVVVDGVQTSILGWIRNEFI